MRALTILGAGGPDVLEVRDVPDPVAGPGQVVVRVRAASLNRADLLQRRGLYPAPPGVPADIPGLEFAGEVEPTGERVMGIVAGGAQAEKLAVDRRVLMAIPEGLTFAEAGAIPEAFLTAYDALFERGRLQAGETVLLRAAASGVGLAAAALAKDAGAVPIALTRTEEKRKRLASMGYATSLPPGWRVDVVIDFVGASAWAENLDALAPLGRLVLVGTLSGSRVELDLGVLMRKRLSVVGTVLRTRTAEEKAALSSAFAARVLPGFAAGRLRPVVDRTFPLEEAAAAHAVMERNENFGKLVLTL